MGGVASSLAKVAKIDPTARRGLVNHNQTLGLPELSHDVNIYWDETGVPHIYGKTAKDVITAQGYAAASERLWQMETLRRLAFGRLSEILGPKGLPVDRAARTWGWGRLAVQDIAHLVSKKPSEDEFAVSTLKLLGAYVAGINAHIRTLSDDNIPMEFQLIGAKPEPWTLEHVASVFRVLSAQMGFGFFHKMITATMAAEFGEDMVSALEPHCHPDEHTHLPVQDTEGVDLNILVDALGGEENFARDQGSNAWVLSGEHTASGKPIIANDPHLGISSPTFFFFNHFEAEEPFMGRPFKGIGASVPGIPMLIIGTNARISWAVTVAWVDVEDAVLCKFTDTSMTHYHHDGKVLEADRRMEVIKVKGQADEHYDVVSTHHGPVVRTHVNSMDNAPEFAIRSASLTANAESLLGMTKMSIADSWGAFRDSCSHFLAPTLNLMYADPDGNIGWTLIGRVPIRPKPEMSTTYPVPGWTTEHDWEGLIPWKEMPHVLNPKSGYIVSANHNIAGPNYKHRKTLGHIFRGPHRAMRIIEMIKEIPLGQHTFETSRAMQTDWLSIAARDFVQGPLASVRPTTAATIEVLGFLRDWDFVMDGDAPQPLVYKMLVRGLQREILEPVLGKHWAGHMDGHGWHDAIQPFSVWKNYETMILTRILSNPASSWLDNFEGGVQEAVEKACDSALKEIVANWGSTRSKWTYGAWHTHSAPHAIGKASAVLGRVLNVPGEPIPLGGDGNTVWVGTTAPTDKAGPAVSGPVFRWIRDLGEPKSSRFIMATGNSGMYLSPHYDDHFPKWRAGMLETLRFAESDLIQEAAMKTTVLLGGSGARVIDFRINDNDPNSRFLEYKVMFGNMTFWRRYSALLELHQAVRRSHPNIVTPPFPAKTWSRVSGVDDEFGGTRLEMLAAWMEFVYTNCEQTVAAYFRVIRGPRGEWAPLPTAPPGGAYSNKF